MIKSELTIELYKAFRPYVKKKQLSDYDNSFLKRKVKETTCKTKPKNM